jgi:hypothetical protein
MTAALGGSVALLKPLGWDWPWLAAGPALAVAVLAVPAKIWTGRIEVRVKRTQDRRDKLEGRTLGGTRRQVRDYFDPIKLGVHRSLVPSEVDRTDDIPRTAPLYVPRDIHQAVVEDLVPGRFVLIVGDSASGKTRLAFEAMRQVLQAHRLVAPERGALREAVEEMAGIRAAVLWLDDLERYLGTDGLTPELLDQAIAGTGHHRLILATLRTQELNTLQENITTDPRGRDRVKLLESAETHNLDRDLTATEIDRAKDRDHDPRIAEALSNTDRYGFAEYLAAGPQLLTRWNNAWTPGTHPRAAALVQAAVDCRRANYLAPIPVKLIIELHTHYLDRRGQRLRAEPLDQAWAWATAIWEHTTALLERDNDHVEVFDYLVDHSQRANPHHHVPDTLIRTMIDYAEPATTLDIGYRAHTQGRYRVAHHAYDTAQQTFHSTKGAEHPDTLTSRNNLALVLVELGRFGEAETMHRDTLASRERVLGSEHGSIP